MKPKISLLLVTATFALPFTQLVTADELMIADKGATEATIVVSPQAGTWEKQAATDLVLYIERMSGAKVPIANTPESIAAAQKAKTPLLIIGLEALKAEPDLGKDLAKVAKKNAELQADAIVLRRAGNRVYLAGANDDSHYFAVAELLRRWGCRRYLPSDSGECIP